MSIYVHRGGLCVYITIWLVNNVYGRQEDGVGTEIGAQALGLTSLSTRLRLLRRKLPGYADFFDKATSIEMRSLS